MRCAHCAIRSGVTVIEDAACAAGSTYRGRPVGAGAALAAFSFHPRKLLTTGEGGMLTTPDGSIAARLRRLREHGMDISAADRHRSQQPVIEHYTEVGFNFRMTDIQAAIGLVQLRKLPEMVARRRALAQRYQELLSGIPGLLTADDPPYGETNYQSFWMLLPEESPVGRDELMRLFADAGISVRRGIMAAHLEPAYAGCQALPAGDRAADQALADPSAFPRYDGVTAGTGGICRDVRAEQTGAGNVCLMTVEARHDLIVARADGLASNCMWRRETIDEWAGHRMEALIRLGVGRGHVGGLTSTCRWV